MGTRESESTGNRPSVAVEERPLAFRHIVSILGSISIILWSVVLAGCTSSNSLRNVSLFTLSYKENPAREPLDSLLVNANITQVISSQISESANAIREVRVGYFSLCVASNSGAWSCSPSAEDIVASVVSGGDGDPLNLVRLAERIRTQTFFYGLIIISQVFLLIKIGFVLILPSFPNPGGKGIVRRYIFTIFPSRAVLPVALLASFAASLFGFLSAFWQHIGGAGASTLTRILTYDTVTAQVGATSVALAWVAAGASGIATIAVLLIIVSRAVLQRLLSQNLRNSESSDN